MESLVIRYVDFNNNLKYQGSKKRGSAQLQCAMISIYNVLENCYSQFTTSLATNVFWINPLSRDVIRQTRSERAEHCRALHLGSTHRQGQEILTTRKARLSPFRSRIIGIKGQKKGSKQNEEEEGGGGRKFSQSPIKSPNLHCSRREDITFVIFV